MKTYPVYLDGKLSFTENTFAVTNPADNEVVGKMSSIGRPQVATAIHDSHEAFRLWRQLPGKARGDFLHQIAH